MQGWVNNFLINLRLYIEYGIMANQLGHENSKNKLNFIIYQQW